MPNMLPSREAISRSVARRLISL